MSDPEDIDQEASEEFDQFVIDFIEEYGYGRFYWMMRTSMDYIEREQARNDPHNNNNNDDNDGSDFRVDDDLF